MFASWLGQLSCALQKANVACLRSAGAGGRCPAPEARAEGAGQEPGEDDVEGDDWITEAVEDLVLRAAAAAEAEQP